MRQRIVALRAKCEDVTAVRKKLLGIGAKPLDAFCQVDTYFNVPSGEMCLRVINGGRGFLVYRPDKRAGDASEVFLAKIENPSELAALLKAALGIKCVIHRVREVYSWEDMRVYIDRISGLGSFVELQAKVGRGVERERVPSLLEAMRKLGISETKFVDEPYSDLLRRKDEP